MSGRIRRAARWAVGIWQRSVPWGLAIFAIGIEHVADGEPTMNAYGATHFLAVFFAAYAVSSGYEAGRLAGGKTWAGKLLAMVLSGVGTEIEVVHRHDGSVPEVNIETSP